MEEEYATDEHHFAEGTGVRRLTLLHVQLMQLSLRKQTNITNSLFVLKILGHVLAFLLVTR